MFTLRVGAPALDSEHPPPPRSPAPSFCRVLVSQLLPPRLRNGERALTAGRMGADVALLHEVALGYRQFRSVGLQGQPPRHVRISRDDVLGSVFGLLLGHRSQKQPGKHLQFQTPEQAAPPWPTHILRYPGL